MAEPQPRSDDEELLRWFLDDPPDVWQFLVDPADVLSRLTPEELAASEQDANDAERPE